MYANLAQLLLVLSIFLGFLVPLILLWLKKNAARLFSQIIIGQFICISFAFIALSFAYLNSDFSLLNVFRNSHQAVPLLYKFTGIWSNHEGSMLLWIFLLTTCNLIFAQHKLPDRQKIYISAIQIVLTSSLLCYLILKSNPFIRISPIPEQGMGFNPLLQDIGLAIHPPILYIGYVTTSIGFAIACAALINKKLPTELLGLLKTWNLFSWSFLSLGVALGSWWAYRELGWGGYWFWDPVENASLLPWLTSSALLHSVYATKKLDTNYKWTIFLSLMGFLLAILATFLVRSGIVTSVHSFAQDQNRGMFILASLSCYSIFALGLFSLRAHLLKNNGQHNLLSRFGGINIANILWSLAALVLLFSLLYPLILANTTGEQITVEREFFVKSFIPLLLGILFLLSLTLPATWQNILPIHYRHFIYSLILAILATIIFYYYSYITPSIIANVGFFIGSLVVIRMIFWKISRPNPSFKFYLIWLVHLVAGLLALTIAFLETNSQELLVSLKQGEQVKFAGFNINFAKIENIAIDNYLGSKVILYLAKDNYELATLTPEVRYYPVEQSQTSEASSYHNLFYDVYAVISESKQDGTITFKLYFKPLISWIWLISLISFICGILLIYLDNKKKHATN